MKQINKNEIWEMQADGSTILVRVEEVEVDIKTPEEEIAERELELIEMFSQLMEMKSRFNG